MLIEFTVGNYRSFRDKKTFTMVATAEKEHEYENVFECGKLNLLKSAGIYGPNSSGKSNFINALSKMKDLIINSQKESQAGQPINIEPFLLNPRTEAEPSYFEIVFYSKYAQKRYRYGFEANRKGIISEWLFYTPDKPYGREVFLFEREGDRFDIGNQLKAEANGLGSRTRPNALFLSVLAQFNSKTAIDVMGWFLRLAILSGINDIALGQFTAEALFDGKKSILDFIKQFDLGFDRIDVSKEDIPKSKKDAFLNLLHLLPDEIRNDVNLSSSVTKVNTSHKRYNDNGQDVGETYFDMEIHESDGTQRIFALAWPLLDVLNSGMVLVIDELEARLHEKLIKRIIQLFNSRFPNRKNAQLIFATHNLSILSSEFFRRDQIYLVEKDKYGASDLFSLSDIKGVTNKEKFSKEYMLGKYGAIPYLEDLDTLGDLFDGETQKK